MAAESFELRTRRKNTSKGLVFGAVALSGLFIVGIAAAAGGGKKPKPKKEDQFEEPPPPPAPPEDPPKPPKKIELPAPPPPKDEPPEPDPPQPDPEPEPVDPNALEFDLEDNWGGTPMVLRIWFARFEIAARIPGLARFLAVKAWQAFRATKPYVSTTEAAKIAAASPQLGRLQGNPNDGVQSKKGIADGIAQGWPVPVDRAGWEYGSRGLFDILGSSAVWAGVHTDLASWLPYVKVASAEAAMETYEVQGGAASYIVRRILLSPNYKVLDPAPLAEDGDSFQTWGNIASAYAGPEAYKNGTQAALDAKTRFLGRATEIGIDLAKVAYPWPPGVSYKAPGWTFKQVYTRIADAAKRQVVNIGGQGPSKLMNLAQGLKGLVLTGNVPGGDEAPLLVVLHGRDADEQQLRSTVDPIKVAARIVYLRGNKPGSPGMRFFDAMLTDASPGLDAQINAATDAVEAAIAELTLTFPVTQVLVLGYSQGGAIAYNLAARGTVGAVLVVAGFLPVGLRPKDQTDTLVAVVHGDMDKAVSIARADASYESFIMKSPDVKFKKVAGGDHGLKSLRSTVQAFLAELAKD